MKFTVIALFLIVGPACADSMDPIAKVLGMFDDLEAKITTAGEKEEKAFKEFFDWCDDAASELKNEITTATKDKEKQEATIAKATADGDDADTAIGELAGSIAKAEEELATATEIREKEAKEFAKAEGELADARKAEQTAKHNYEMLKQSLEDDITNANKDLDAAKKSLAGSAENKATAQGDLTVTSKALAADIATLEDLHKDCLTKAQDFEAETKSRSEELKALAEAKKILKETTAGAEAQTYGLNQESFLQITSKAGLAQFEAVRLVRDLARKEHSRALTQLASRLEMTVRASSAQGADPFAKVKGLISDMIASLEEAADADATEKAYCDKELAETRAKKDDKTAEIKKLSTKIDQMSTRSAKLREEVAVTVKSYPCTPSSRAAKAAQLRKAIIAM